MWDVHLLSHLRIQLINQVFLGLHLLLNSCIPGNQKKQCLAQCFVKTAWCLRHFQFLRCIKWGWWLREVEAPWNQWCLREAVIKQWCLRRHNQCRLWHGMSSLSINFGFIYDNRLFFQAYLLFWCLQYLRCLACLSLSHLDFWLLIFDCFSYNFRFRLTSAFSPCFESIGDSFLVCTFTQWWDNSFLNLLWLCILFQESLTRTIRSLGFNLWRCIMLVFWCLFMKVSYLLRCAHWVFLLVPPLHMAFDVVWSTYIFTVYFMALDYCMTSVITWCIKCWLRHWFLLH